MFPDLEVDSSLVIPNASRYCKPILIVKERADYYDDGNPKKKV